MWFSNNDDYCQYQLRWAERTSKALDFILEEFVSYLDQDTLSWLRYSWSSSVPPGKWQDRTWIRQRPLLRKFFSTIVIRPSCKHPTPRSLDAKSIVKHSDERNKRCADITKYDTFLATEVIPTSNHGLKWNQFFKVFSESITSKCEVKKSENSFCRGMDSHWTASIIYRHANS